MSITIVLRGCTWFWGNFQLQKAGPWVVNSPITRIGAFAEVVVAKVRAGLVEAKKLVVDGVDILKKLTELENKVNTQQKQIDDLKKTVEELKKK